MITGAIKNKVDKIWTDIWAGGITNPLTVIEQLTYLMFIRSLDEKELETEEFENMSGEKMDKIFPQSLIGQSMRWSRFKNDDPRDIYDVISQRVFPAIKNMKHGHLPDFTPQGEMIEIADGGGDGAEKDTAFARYMSDAMFLIPTPQVLQKIITGLSGRPVRARHFRFGYAGRPVRVYAGQAVHRRPERPVPHAPPYHPDDGEIGRASCRERV